MSDYDQNEVNKDLANIADSEREYDENLEVYDKAELPQNLQFHQTATTAFKTGRKPRTSRAAYDHSTNTMYVVFYTGVYYMYADVPPAVWADFKRAQSPGAFLWENGFDARGPMGIVYAYQPVDMNTIAPARKAALTANLEQAKKRQEGLQGKKTVKTLYPKGTRYSKPNRGGF